ncbi:MAG: hypothetical protein ACOZBX_02860 [Campylobacterota bacterium]
MRIGIKRTAVVVAALIAFGGCVPQPEVHKAAEQKCMSAAQLNMYSYDHLARTAKLLREDKKNIESFEGFIQTMKGAVDDYSRMIKSSIYISNVVRFLPVPYAGEVSSSAKLVSKTVLNLGGAASALDRYQKSTDSYLAAFDKLDPQTASSAEIVKLARFADTRLLEDADNLQVTLRDISESTAALAATTQSIADALDVGSGYVNQVKNLVGMSPENTDKVHVAENRHSINARMTQLNQKISLLENSARTHRDNIAKARIYSDLALETQKREK